VVRAARAGGFTDPRIYRLYLGLSSREPLSGHVLGMIMNAELMAGRLTTCSLRGDFNTQLSWQLALMHARSRPLLSADVRLSARSLSLS
jgi:hypothetical protein